jgi:hypothetical protein
MNDTAVIYVAIMVTMAAALLSLQANFLLFVLLFIFLVSRTFLSKCEMGRMPSSQQFIDSSFNFPSSLQFIDSSDSNRTSLVDDSFNRICHTTTFNHNEEQSIDYLMFSSVFSLSFRLSHLVIINIVLRLRRRGTSLLTSQHTY